MSISRRKFRKLQRRVCRKFAYELKATPVCRPEPWKNRRARIHSGHGTGSRYLQYKEEDQAIEAITKGLNLGITYIDSADDYGKEHLARSASGRPYKAGVTAFPSPPN